VPPALAQLSADCSGVAVVAVGRDPVRYTATPKEFASGLC
jgi:hypothetical protein